MAIRHHCVQSGLIALVAVSWSLVGLAAQNSKISGRVVSPEGFGHATVFVLKCIDSQCLDQAPVRSFHPDADGRFRADDLAPGWYSVLAFQRGLTPGFADAFNLKAGREAQVEIVLGAQLANPPEVRYPEASADDLASFDEVLAVMEEPSFCSPLGLSGGESYRFLWLRSFHHPILIEFRILEGERALAIYKETDGGGSEKPTRLISRRNLDLKAFLAKTDKDVDEEGVRRVIATISKEAEDYFWSLPFEVDRRVIGLDGATWTVEGRRDGKCHVVTRWSPDKQSKLRWFAETLINLSGKRFYYDEFY